jgi:hypothetical protein
MSGKKKLHSNSKEKGKGIEKITNSEEEGETFNELLEKFALETADLVLKSQNPLTSTEEIKIQHENENTNVLLEEDEKTKQQLGRYQFETIKAMKQNILIRKLMMIYLMNFLVSSGRWYAYSQCFYKRHSRGIVYLQFSSIESLAKNGRLTFFFFSHPRVTTIFPKKIFPHR